MRNNCSRKTLTFSDLSSKMPGFTLRETAALGLCIVAAWVLSSLQVGGQVSDPIETQIALYVADYDFDGDGIDDLVIPEIVTSPLSDLYGEVRILSGSSNGELHAYQSDQLNDLFGFDTAVIGDIDSDGIPDIAVGAPWSRDNFTLTGRVDVISGATGEIISSIQGPDRSEFGRRISYGGDLNGDGKTEILISAILQPLDSWGEEIFGEVYAYTAVDGAFVCRIWSGEDFDGLGLAISSAGDLNNDGYGDLALAVPNAQAANSRLGRIYFFLGRDFNDADESDFLNLDSAFAHYDNSSDDIMLFGTSIMLTTDQDDDGLLDMAVLSERDPAVSEDIVEIQVFSSVTMQLIESQNLENAIQVYPIGDVNASLDVDTNDLSQVIAGVGTSTTITNINNADLDGDGEISASDVMITVTQIGQTSVISDLSLSAGLTQSFVDGNDPWDCPSRDGYDESGNTVHFAIDPCCAVGTGFGTLRLVDYATCQELLENEEIYGNGTNPPTTNNNDSGNGVKNSNERTRTNPNRDDNQHENSREETVENGTPGDSLGGSGASNGAAYRTSNGRSTESELDRNGPGEKTCDPVILSSGLKTERESDIYVTLPGRDFELIRSYIADQYLNYDFPWMIGSGWSTSADGWVSYRQLTAAPGFHVHDKVYDNWDPELGQLVVTAMPIENSTTFFETGGGVYRPLGPGYSTARTSVASIRGESVPVWVIEKPGEGQTLYYRTADSYESLKVLNGRILQQHDEYGNPWTYNYVRFRDETGSAYGEPYLDSIYLGSTSAASAHAIVEFSWDVGSNGDVGTGALRSARVLRHSAGSSALETQSVHYTYAGDDEQYQSISSTTRDLVLVEQRTLLNAPETGSSMGGETPEWYSRFTHYRYKGSGTTTPGRLYMTFLPEQIEAYAERWGSQSSSLDQPAAVGEAAHELMLLDDIEPLAGPGEPDSTTVSELASKLITFYSHGWRFGRVKSETIRNGCACGGASGSALVINFEYKRRLIVDQSLQYNHPVSGASAVNMQGRWSYLTVRTETVDGQINKIIRNWSEDRLLNWGWITWASDLEHHGHPDTWITSFYTWPVSFVIANQVEDANSNTWFTYHEFDDHVRTRSYQPSAISLFSVITDEDDPTGDSVGLLKYDAAIVPIGNEPTSPKPAIMFKDGGLVKWFDIDEFGRETKAGVAKSDAAGDLIEDTKSTISETTYVSNDVSHSLRIDLKESILRYPIGGSNQVERTDYSYLFATRPHLARKAVLEMTESTPRETIAQNGPGAAQQTVDSISRLSTEGLPIWTLGWDGSVTRYAHDEHTGERTLTVSNADPDDFPSVPIITNNRHQDGGSLSTSAAIDILGRPIHIEDAASVTTSYRYGLSMTEALLPEGSALSGASTSVRSSRLPYLTVTTSPHELPDGSFNGPEVKEWATAAGNLLRTSAFNKADSAAHETARTMHSYDALGLHHETRMWHDIENDLFDPSTFEYDGLGRLVSTTDPNGYTTRTTYDWQDRVVQISQANPNAGEQAVERFYYDHVVENGAARSGIGDGNLTLSERLWGSGPDDVRRTFHIYDWRNRPRLSYQSEMPDGSTSVEDALTVTVPDNLGRTLLSATIAGGADMTGLVSDLKNDAISSDNFGGSDAFDGHEVLNIAELSYSDRGLVYQKRTQVFPESGSPAGFTTQTWYDDAGRALVTVPPSGPITKVHYDGHGRVVRSVTSDGGSIRAGATPSFADATALEHSSDTVYEESTQIFDEQSGLSLLRTNKLRTPAIAPDPGGFADPIQSFSATVYDGAARPIASVDYGSDSTPVSMPDTLPFSTGGVAPVVPLTQAPTRSDAVLVSETRYDGIGRPFESVDTMGRVSRTLFDDRGRVIASIDNASAIDPTEGDPIRISRNPTDGFWEIERPAGDDPDQNRVTSMHYDGVGNITARIAHVPQASGEQRQVTQYLYKLDSVPGTGISELDTLSVSPNLLYEIRYPSTEAGALEGLPSADPQDIVRFGYNNLGERSAKLDQNGTLFRYERDAQGRIVDEIASDPDQNAASQHINFGVTKLSTLYDPFGRVERVQSSGSFLFNEIQTVYDSLGRLQSTSWNPLGAADDIEAQSVQQDYMTLASGQYNNIDRMMAVTYPSDGLTVHRGYGYQPDPNNPLFAPDTTDPNYRMSRLTDFRVTSDGANQNDIFASHAYIGLNRRVRTHYFAANNPVGLTRDRISGSTAGFSSPGEYLGLDRFGRVKRNMWSLGLPGGHPGAPAIINTAYDYDASSNIIARADERGGDTAAIRDELHQFDGLNRLTETTRGDDSLAPLFGSERWNLDHAGNWTDQDRAAADLGYDESRAFEVNATNELIEVTDGLFNRDRSYNAAGALITERLPDGADAQGETQERRRSYEYDAWGRLTKVILEKRAPGQNSWSKHSTLVAYSYYAGNQRATRTVRTSADGSEPADDEPDERTLYTYDSSWNLLEERVESPYVNTSSNNASPRWTWKSGSGANNFQFAQIDPAAQFSIRQYVWDPTSKDELVLFRHDGDDYFALTDHRRDVVALVPAGGDTDAIERVRYSSYGVAEPQLVSDIDADGDVDTDDITIVASLDTLTATDAGWRADADLNLDGVIDGADLLLVTDNLGSTAPDLWDAPCSVGYAGGMREDVLGLWLFRNRWYDSVNGKWLTRDPAGYVDGLNLYQYVSGNPMMYWDPFGLYGLCQWWSELKEGAGFVGEVGAGVGGNVAEIATDSVNLIEDVGLAAGNTLGLVSDETFLNNSETIVGIGASIEERGVGGTITAAGEAAVQSVVDTVDGISKMDPNAVADALTAVGEVAVGSKGLSKLGKLGKLGKSGNGSVGKAGDAAGAAAESAAKIHKNSKSYVGETHVYRIDGPDGLHKVGQSAQGLRKRDGASIRGESQSRKLQRNSGDFHRSKILKSFDNKADALIYENRLLTRYKRRFGNLPPGNKVAR